MPTTTFNLLLGQIRRVYRLNSISGLLGWDEQVNLPPGSAQLRAEQNSTLADIIHREATQPRIGEWLASLHENLQLLEPDQQLLIRETKRCYDRLTRIPTDFVARRAAAQSNAYHAWTHAREADDFVAFAPHLQEQLQFAKDEAAFLEAPDSYDYWIDSFDPGMSRSLIDPLFTTLRAELIPLVQTISASPHQPDPSIFRNFPVDQQEAFLREVVQTMGFDFSRGRIDVAVHPFCSGHPLDVRMTTRYAADNPLDSLSSAMHETGHALYEQGLPAEWLDTPLGEAAGMAVHESQSRLWENQIGRSREFWNHWEPNYRVRFTQQLAGIDSDTLYRAINRVAITPIRVDADEVTYNLHIMLRYELEKQLFSGKLAVADLPQAWNQLSAEFLGYTPKNNREGCLQDVHWSGGAFGYFPSYCLGNLLAAQIWYKIREVFPDLDQMIQTANFQPLLAWLRANVHQKGRRMRTHELTLAVTGQELSTQSLVRYLNERYLHLYT